MQILPLFFLFLFACLSFGVDEDMHMALAHQMYKSGSYKQALEHSNSVYERNPLRTDNLLLLGAIYYQVESISVPSLFILIAAFCAVELLLPLTFFI